MMIIISQASITKEKKSAMPAFQCCRVRGIVAKISPTLTCLVPVEVWSLAKATTSNRSSGLKEAETSPQARRSQNLLRETWSPREPKQGNAQPFRYSPEVFRRFFRRAFSRRAVVAPWSIFSLSLSITVP